MITPALRLGLAASVGLLAVASAAPSPTHTSHGSCADPAVLRRVETSVVGVSVVAANSPETAVGIVLGTARVLTVAHAVLAGGARVMLPDASTAMNASVVTLDRRRDLAILDVPGLQGAALISADVPPVAASCATMVTMRGGRVVAVDAAVRRSVEVSIDAPAPAHRVALELTVAVRRGDSGAPIIDGSGRVEGVMFAASSSGSPTGWAVGASELKGLLGGSLVAG